MALPQTIKEKVFERTYASRVLSHSLADVTYVHNLHVYRYITHTTQLGATVLSGHHSRSRARRARSTTFPARLTQPIVQTVYPAFIAPVRATRPRLDHATPATSAREALRRPRNTQRA